MFLNQNHIDTKLNYYFSYKDYCIKILIIHKTKPIFKINFD